MHLNKQPKKNKPTLTFSSDFKQPEILLKIEEVKYMTGLSKSSIYLKIQESSFPKNVSVGLRAKRWKLSEVQQWILSRC